MNIVYTCPKCGADLRDLCLPTYPPKYQKKCFSCGWVSEITREDEVRIPYPDHAQTINGFGMDNINEACRCCSNHPSNGGKGMESIMRIMDVVGVSRFNAMKGKIVRVATKGLGSSIKIIGNVLSDKWFDAESFYSEADEEEERKDIPDDVDELRNFVAQSLKEKYDQVNIRKMDTDIIVNVKETNNGRNDVWIQFPYFHSR